MKCTCTYLRKSTLTYIPQKSIKQKITKVLYQILKSVCDFSLYVLNRNPSDILLYKNGSKNSFKVSYMGKVLTLPPMHVNAIFLRISIYVPRLQ